MSSIDLKYCIRSLCRTPLSTIAIVATLAVGIGGSTAIFAVVDAMLFKALPFPHSDRLIAVNQVDVRSGDYTAASMRGFLAYSQETGAAGLLAAYRSQALNVSGAGQAEQVAGVLVAGPFFDVLGISPIAGRTFQDSDPDGAIVLSFAHWQTRFHGDRSVIGKPLIVDGIPGTVVGVMPADFHFPLMQSLLWRRTTGDYPIARETPNLRFLKMIARLPHADGQGRARAQLEAARARLADQSPNLFKNLRIAVPTLKEDMVGASQPVLTAVSVLVALVLLTACINTAILQLARSANRSKELAIRVAVGASPVQVARVLFLESALLSTAGAVAGLLLAVTSLRLTVTLSPFRIPRSGEIGIGAPALLFALLLMLLTSMASGLVPAAGAVRQWFPSLNGRGSTSQRARWTMSLLAMIEVVAATILLSASILAIQSFVRLASVDVGFPSGGLLTVSLRLQKMNYANRAALDSFQTRIYRQIATIPGVQKCGGASHIPLLSGFLSDVSIRDSSDGDSSEREAAGQSAASPEYFQSMGIRILSGREFNDFDRAGGERVAIVNESMARQYWANQDPLGKHIRPGRSRDSNPWYRVVGVVRDIHHFGLSAQPRPTVYFPFLQLPAAYEQLLGRTAAIAIRSSVDPSRLAPSIRKTLTELDPDLASDIRPMSDIIAESIAPQEFPTVVVAVFASIALWLAGLGLYVVMATMAARRMPEMGLRIALGASPGSIVILMLRSAILLVCGGLLIGTGGALLLSRSWRSILPDASAMNPEAIVFTALLLCVTSLLAAWWPARKAASADPVSMIRAE